MPGLDMASNQTTFGSLAFANNLYDILDPTTQNWLLMNGGLNTDEFGIQNESQNNRATKHPRTGKIVAALRQKSMLKVMKKGINNRTSAKSSK